jgi:hypothetical protein
MQFGVWAVDLYRFWYCGFLPGAAEAGFLPGVILYITYWYPAHYRAIIVGILMVAIPVGACAALPAAMHTPRISLHQERRDLRLSQAVNTGSGAGVQGSFVR